MGLFRRHPKVIVAPAGGQTVAPAMGTRQVTTTTYTTTGAPGAMGPTAMAAPVRRRGRLSQICCGSVEERRPMAYASNPRHADFAHTPARY
jgi:hypothetical protein